MKVHEKNEIKLVFVIIVSFAVSRIIMFLMHLRFDNGATFFENMCRWDTDWYISIIDTGYHETPCWHWDESAANWAFFPFMPLVVRYFSILTGLSYYASGFIVNSTAFMFALFWLAKWMLLEKWEFEQVIYMILFLCFMPYSFYYSSIYTEAFFMLFIVLFFYNLKRKNYILMGIAGGLASATRNTGIMLVFAVAIHYIVEYASDKKSEFKLRYMVKDVFSNGKLVLGVCLMPLGLFSYMLYLYKFIGDGMAFVHIERAWNHQFDLANIFTTIPKCIMLGTPDKLYFAMFFIIWLFSLILLAKDKRWGELMFSGISYFIVASSGQPQSIARYFVGASVTVFELIRVTRCWKWWQKTVMLLFLVIWEVVLFQFWLEKYHVIVI